jgi:glycogen synthase
MVAVAFRRSGTGLESKWTQIKPFSRSLIYGEPDPQWEMRIRQTASALVGFARLVAEFSLSSQTSVFGRTI